jgi:proteic killer suppression protein
VLGFQAIERVGRRKLLYLHAARKLEELRVPPGNRLEALKGDRTGQYSIRIVIAFGSLFTERRSVENLLRLA